MATISFAPKGDQTTTAAPAPVTALESVTNTIAVVEPKTVTVISTTSAPAGIEGEITQDDLRVPRVNLVQKAGQLCDSFAPGTFLFEKQIVIAKPGEVFTAIPLRMKKYYQEKVEFGTSSDMPAKANTAEEVRALGGSLIYGHERYFQDVADIMLAVQAPENLDEEAMQYFAYSNGTHHYGLGIYTVAASAYTSLGKRLVTDATFLLRGGLYTGKYEINSELRKNGTNSWYVPNAKFAGKNNETDTEFFKNLAGI